MNEWMFAAFRAEELAIHAQGFAWIPSHRQRDDRKVTQLAEYILNTAEYGRKSENKRGKNTV